METIVLRYKVFKVYIINHYFGKFKIFDKEKLDWLESEKYCKALGGTLADKDNFPKNFIKKNSVNYEKLFWVNRKKRNRIKGMFWNLCLLTNRAILVEASCSIVYGFICQIENTILNSPVETVEIEKSFNRKYLSFSNTHYPE